MDANANATAAVNADLTSKSFIESLVGCPISNWEASSACAAGDNMAGSVKALRVTLKEPSDKQLHLIFKNIPANPPDWIIDGQIFRKEHAVYRSVVPAMQNYSSSRGIPYSSPLPIYHKGFNNDKDDFLLLQDVRPEGFIMKDKRISLTFPEMSIIMQEIAKFHATAYAMLRHEGSALLDTDTDFKFLTKTLFPKTDDDDKVGDPFDNFIQLYFQIIAELMQVQIPELAPRIAKVVPNAWKVRRNAVKNSAYFQTIIHSDLWTNNLLLKYDDTTKVPVSVKFIDFQFASIGNIFSDLTYLVFTSTTPEFRKHHLVAILGVYWEAFRQTVVALGVPLPIGFTMGFVQDEFQACHFAALVHMGFAVPLQLGDMVGVEAEWKEEKREGDVLTSPEHIKKMIVQSSIALERIRQLFQEAAALNVI